MRLIRAFAALAAFASLAVGSLAMPAQAAQQDYFATVAANLKTGPVYVDPKASPSISAGEASTLTSKIKASGRPIFLVLMDNSQVGSNTADQVLSKIAAGLNRPAVIGVSSNKGFAANGYSLPGSIMSQAGPLAKQAVQQNRDAKTGQPIPFQAYNAWIGSVSNLVVSTPPNNSTRTNATAAPKQESSNTGWIVLACIVGGLLVIGLIIFMVVRSKRKSRAKERAARSKNSLEREIQQVNSDALGMTLDENVKKEAQTALTSALTNAQSAQSEFDAGNLDEARAYLREAREQYNRAKQLNDGTTTNRVDEPEHYVTDTRPDGYEEEDVTDRSRRQSAPRNGTQRMRVKKPGGGTTIITNNYNSSRSNDYPYYFGGGMVGGQYWGPGYYAYQPSFLETLVLVEMLEGHHHGGDDFERGYEAGRDADDRQDTRGEDASGATTAWDTPVETSGTTGGASWGGDTPADSTPASSGWGSSDTTDTGGGWGTPASDGGGGWGSDPGGGGGGFDGGS